MDHIIEAADGGTDDPSNLQKRVRPLLQVEDRSGWPRPPTENVTVITIMTVCATTTPALTASASAFDVTLGVDISACQRLGRSSTYPVGDRRFRPKT